MFYVKILAVVFFVDYNTDYYDKFFLCIKQNKKKGKCETEMEIRWRSCCYCYVIKICYNDDIKY